MSNSLMRPLQLKTGLVFVLSMVLIWGTAVYEMGRSQDAYLREAEIRTTVQARVFAEYSRSTFKRINEIALNTRRQWSGDWKSFKAVVETGQASIQDIAFQVAIIDRQGLLAFSNLAKPTDRTDLSEREHFKVHAQSQDADKLFISKPVKGKVSGKWSLQFTRPILKNSGFDGVIVISISPDLFADFALTMNAGHASVVSMVRDSGEIMSRFPQGDQNLGRIMTQSPYMLDSATPSGHFRRTAATDRIDRIYGYYKLPEYGQTFVVGEAVKDALAPALEARNMVLVVAGLVSLLSAFLFMLFIRSLNASDQLQHDLEEEKYRAEAANRAKSEFLANMSHEIRTPMNGVLGMAQVLTMPDVTEEERIDYAQTILNSGNILMGLLNDILDLSKIDAGKLSLESRDMEPARVIHEVQTLFAQNVLSKGLQIESVWNGPAGAYRSDPHRLNQMLCNLVGNALKFTNEGSIRIEANEVERSESHATLEFSVSDTGIGIAPDKLQLLFQAFSQVDASNTRNHDGAGLGLSIVRKLADLMDGEVGVESQLGQGSRFWFRVRVKTS